MEDLIRSRRSIILLLCGAFLIAIPTLVIVVWFFTPQVPQPSFELLVTLNYLSTEFSPLAAFAYLWYSIQPSFEWIWGLIFAMIIAIVVLVFLFYYVLPIVVAEMKEREKMKSK
ncbi:MAG: hypothetical protein ACUVXA_12985 [Candidatus Jordarchaeum sp.]|uniref:hypothetical protein n=1 Tax=Candidatus Jordarchaeum sp. TaxID=2823881 RepID=UPI00404AEC9D